MILHGLDTVFFCYQKYFLFILHTVFVGTKPQELSLNDANGPLNFLSIPRYHQRTLAQISVSRAEKFHSLGTG